MPPMSVLDHPFVKYTLDVRCRPYKTGCLRLNADGDRRNVKDILKMHLFCPFARSFNACSTPIP